MFNLLSSFAKKTISSKEGVIKPERPMISTFSSTAVLIIFSGGTITPRSIISKLLKLKQLLQYFFQYHAHHPLLLPLIFFLRNY